MMSFMWREFNATSWLVGPGLSVSGKITGRDLDKEYKDMKKAATVQ